MSGAWNYILILSISINLVMLTNHSAFPALQYDGLDQNDTCFNIVVARITYDINIREKNGRITLVQSSEQVPLNYSDMHYKDPVHSSVQYESDLAPYKPETDVVINATAFSPDEKSTPFFEVAIQVDQSIKTLRINGPRFWKYGLSGWSLGHPEPIDSLDILYEYASGGWHEVDGETFASPNNPSGMGWYPNEYLKRCKKNRLPGPQIESKNIPINNIQELTIPEGFGFFGKSWRGRIEHAGTYDSAWVEERHPYLPRDFDFRYWCGAHPSLQIAHPKPSGNIPVVLWGLVPASEVPDQRVSFHVPVETLFVFVKTESGLGVTKDMLLDTIVIDMRARKVFCSYRITLAEELRASEIQLRHIAIEDRQKQTELAAAINQNASSSTFIPLPPSLSSKR
jgi:hypothetical protein